MGPVCHCLAIVPTGVIIGIHFARHRDGLLDIVKSLYSNVGFDPDNNTKKKRLDGAVHHDRAYSITSVEAFEIKLGLDVHGTKSEKVGKYPFCTTTSGEKQPHQKLVPINTARSVYYASRKLGGKPQHACCYVNGTRGVGNITSTLPF